MTASAPNAPSDATNAALDGLAALLADERLALRRRDVAAIARLAAEKEALFQSLTELLAEDRSERWPNADTGEPRFAPIAERLRWLSGELRRNGILLSYARDSVQGALDIMDKAGLRKGRLRIVG
ncbi:MAG: hypothetical protein IPG50_37805 [Myxococcales bacterium]|nr:hypothetical protein [Myxococcales bacterium]